MLEMSPQQVTDQRFPHADSDYGNDMVLGQGCRQWHQIIDSNHLCWSMIREHTDQTLCTTLASEHETFVSQTEVGEILPCTCSQSMTLIDIDDQTQWMFDWLNNLCQGTTKSWEDREGSRTQPEITSWWPNSDWVLFGNLIICLTVW